MQLGRVHREGAALREALVTVRTGVRLLAGVRPYVLGEVVLHAEGLLAVPAMERLLSCKTANRIGETKKVGILG